MVRCAHLEAFAVQSAGEIGIDTARWPLSCDDRPIKDPSARQTRVQVNVVEEDIVPAEQIRVRADADELLGRGDLVRIVRLARAAGEFDAPRRVRTTQDGSNKDDPPDNDISRAVHGRSLQILDNQIITGEGGSRAHSRVWEARTYLQPCIRECSGGPENAVFAFGRPARPAHVGRGLSPDGHAKAHRLKGTAETELMLR